MNMIVSFSAVYLVCQFQFCIQCTFFNIPPYWCVTETIYMQIDENGLQLMYQFNVHKEC